jgi:uncharacterized protein
VYDINTNSVLRIDDDELFSAILALQKLGEIPESESNSVHRKIISLQKMGYLHSNDVQSITNPLLDDYNLYIHSAISRLVLQVTQQCNFRCFYCPYSFDGTVERKHADLSMSWDIAKRAIDILMTNSHNSKQLSIGFYGGEPMLKRPLIERCMQYAETMQTSKTLSYFMTTNGALIDESFLHLIESKNFYFTISFDGPKTAHDKNRRFSGSGKGTFDVVYHKLRLITEKFPHLTEKFVINAVWDGIADIREIYSFFDNDPIVSKFRYTIAPFDDSESPISLNIGAENILALREISIEAMLGLIDSVERKNMSLYGINQLRHQFNNKQRLTPNRFHNGPCIPGVLKLFVDVNGYFYPCEKASDRCMQFGNVFDGFAESSIKRLLCLDNLSQEDCANCWAFRLCSQCCLAAANGEEFSQGILTNSCNAFRQGLLRSISDIIYLVESKTNIRVEV